MSGNSLNSYKAAYYTLGCKLNFSETSGLMASLSARGISRAEEGVEPDIIVVNTCSVTESADKKGRQLIRRLATGYPDATLIVTGCYAQLKADEIARMKGVDIVLGSNEKMKLEQYLDRWLETRTPIMEVTPFREIREFSPSCERGDRTRYFLKVQDGCDYFCTYCTIPFARGGSRNASVASIVSQAEAAASAGGKEIVITGVNIGDFGHSTGETFFQLIRQLDKVAGIERYRISSIEPNLLTEEMVSWIAGESKAFMPHFHIPLQAGTDEVLKLMNRRYDTSLFRSRIEMIKSLMPDSFIGVDVIAGARGESGELFEQGMKFIESLPITRLHVFPYSERPGTAALHLGNPVTQEEKHRRVQQLMELSDKKIAGFARSLAHKKMKVLWEQPSHGDRMNGFTENYLRVSAPYEEEKINCVTEVVLPEYDSSTDIISEGFRI